MYFPGQVHLMESLANGFPTEALPRYPAATYKGDDPRYPRFVKSARHLSAPYPCKANTLKNTDILAFEGKVR